MSKYAGLALLVLCLALPVRAETLAFTSHTYPNMPKLMQGQPGPEVEIQATLDFPVGPGPYPALVVAHSCAGLSGKAGMGERNILEEARANGFATLIYDSFAVRDWHNVCAGGAGAAATPTVIADAFAALQALAKDSRINADSIFIAGASMGGMTSWATALEPWRRRLAGGDLRFAGHVAFYPSGDNGFMDDNPFTGSPILVMFGSQDNWTPPTRQRLLMERQMSYARPAPDVRFIQYDDAQHGWLNAHIPDPLAKGAWLKEHEPGKDETELPKVRSRLDCPLIFSSEKSKTAHLIWMDGREQDVPLQDIPQMTQDCGKPGVTMAGSVAVSIKSLDEMVRMMKAVLKK